ncbi:MAG TPA: hypothetical protein VIG32_06495 [Candidatus Baltobacteraceae bacterium]|jgi:phosphoribosylformylglycinamidine (FGAM) synthase PurS component
MTGPAVAIRLKIPDNEAYTALTALRRLGVDVARVERAVIYAQAAAGNGDFVDRIARNETLFNSNKHVLEVRENAIPLTGETWIEELAANDPSRPRRYVAWRLFSAGNEPVDAAILTDAATKLLCNPAIERAHFG